MMDLWTTAKAECLDCGKEWQAVYPLAAGNLECPKCRGANTIRGEYADSD